MYDDYNSYGGNDPANAGNIYGGGSANTGSTYGGGSANTGSTYGGSSANAGSTYGGGSYGSNPASGTSQTGGQSSYTNCYNGYSSGGSYQTVPPKKPKKPKKPMGAGAIIALCLVCALVGGAVGGGLSRLNGGTVSSGNGSSNSSGSTSTSINVSDRDATAETVNTNTVAAGTEMTISEIYKTYSDTIVSIEVQTTSGTGAGTGFVITEDGYIVTCYHVIDGATAIAVTFIDSTSYEATYVGGDEDQDIAVLKIEASDLNTVVLGHSSALNVGDTVTTIGNTLGTLANTLTSGVVSALDRALTMSDGTVLNVLQTDCTVNSGNSGGPLFNQYGEVIGIVNAKYSSSGYSSSTATIEGIGFAIPIDDVQDKITDLMEYGYITGKPYLGITVSTVSALNAQQFNMVVGAYVNSVEEGSCAETAGLQANDIITAVDGTEITTYEELVSMKNNKSAGDTMVLTVYRSGQYLTITVTLDEYIPSDNTGTDADTDTDADSQTPGSGNGNSYGYIPGFGFQMPSMPSNGSSDSSDSDSSDGSW